MMLVVSIQVDADCSSDKRHNDGNKNVPLFRRCNFKSRKMTAMVKQGPDCGPSFLVE